MCKNIKVLFILFLNVHDQSLQGYVIDCDEKNHDKLKQ